MLKNKSKAIALLGFGGIVVFLLGFLGQMILNDNAPFPAGWLLSLMTAAPVPLMIAGSLMGAGCLFLGNRMKYGNLKAKNYVSYLLILPAFAFIIAFVIYPMIDVVYLSLFKGNLLKPTKNYLGLKNYYDLFFVKNDFKASFKNTAVYSVSVVVLIIVFAVLFAAWFFQNRRINKIGQTVLFMPHLIASVCSGFIWSWIMSKQDYGLFNTVLGFFGFEPVKWLESSSTAMGCIVFVVVWKSVGYYTLIVMAAMKGIPAEIYEAAQLDAAPKLRQFFKITLPMISPQLFFMLITITIGSFKVFDTIRVMTEGGPGNATNVIAMYVYSYSVQRMNTLGLGTASAVVLMVVLMILTFIYFKLIERKVHYQ